MEQSAINALERVDNPILIILLVVLIGGIIAVFNLYRIAQRNLYDLAVETVGVLKDLNTRLAQRDANNTDDEKR